MNRSKTCTLVGSDKGGVGKSLVSQILVAAYDRVQRPLKVIEIDNQHTLSTVFGDRVDLSMDAVPNQSEGRRRSIDDHYAQPYSLWSEADSVTDLGANVTTPLLNWMHQQEIVALANEDGIDFRFLTMATPDDQSLRSAASSIELARRALGVDADIHIVMNDTMGLEGFAPYHGSDTWNRLMSVIESHRVSTITIPHCDSKLMDWGRAHGLTVVEIVKGGEPIDRICEKAGFNKLQRKIEVVAFIKWLQSVQEAMTPLFSKRKQNFQDAAE